MCLRNEGCPLESSANLTSVRRRHAVGEEMLEAEISFLSLNISTKEEQIAQLHGDKVQRVCEPIQPVSLLVSLLVWQPELTAVGGEGRSIGASPFRRQQKQLLQNHTVSTQQRIGRERHTDRSTKMTRQRCV